jgi:WD40 repeat protein
VSITGTLTVLLLIVCLCACGSSGKKTQAVNRGSLLESLGQQPSKLDDLPVAQPGQLSGRLYYVPYDPASCELHVYDLASGEDQSLGAISSGCENFLFGFTASADGTHVAWLDSYKHLLVRDETGRVLQIPADWAGIGEGEEGAAIWPAFSADSRHVAFCSRNNGRPTYSVADVGTGEIVGEIVGMCRAALTSAGVAVLHNGSVMLGDRPLELDPQSGPELASLDAPYQIASTSDGTRIALLAHGVPKGQQQVTAVVDSYDLEGHALGRYVLSGTLGREDITLMFSIGRLSPTALSAVVWWGCILQLAPFASRARFPLLFGEDGEEVGQIAYSPDGRFAVMGRRDHTPISMGGETTERPPAPDAVVFDGETFAPLYRVPIHSEAVAWVGG